MNLSWSQVGKYVSGLIAAAVVLVPLLLKTQQTFFDTNYAPLWIVLVCEIAWYAAFAGVWNDGRGPRTFVLDFVTMAATRAVMGVATGVLFALIGQGDPQDAYVDALYRYLPAPMFQIFAVPAILYFPVYVPRTQPDAQLAPPPVVEAGSLPALRLPGDAARVSSFEALLGLVTGAEGAGIAVDREGLPLATRLPEDLEPEAFAAYGLELVEPLAALSAKMGLGNIHQAVLHTDKGTVTVLPTDQVVLFSLLDSKVHVGFSPEDARSVGDIASRIYRLRAGGV